MCRYGRVIRLFTSWILLHSVLVTLVGSGWDDPVERPFEDLRGVACWFRLGRMLVRRFVLLVVFALLATAMVVPVALAADTSIAVAVAKAPVAGDGTTAGAVPDFVLSFVDADPSVSGIGIKQDGTVEVVLPDDFVPSGSVDPDLGIILQGWQASPRVASFPPPVFIWTTTVSDQTITLDLTSDFLPIDLANPGPKQVHLILPGFVNPKPGMYDVGLTITPDPAAPGDTFSGVGTVQIIPRSRPSVNIVSVLSGNPPPPPFKNVQYQTVPQGTDPDKVGLYLWGKDVDPFIGVDIVMSNADHYRFVQGNKTVGHIWIDAPAGSSGYSLSTPDGASTGPVPAFATGQPTAALVTQFSPDDATTGRYTITFKLNNGNTQQQFVDVVPAP